MFYLWNSETIFFFWLTCSPRPSLGRLVSSWLCWGMAVDTRYTIYTLQVGYILLHSNQKPRECANYPSSCDSCARDLCRAPRCWRVPARLTRLPENTKTDARASTWTWSFKDPSVIHDTHGWSSKAKGSSIFYDNPAAMEVAENHCPRIAKESS